MTPDAVVRKLLNDRYPLTSGDGGAFAPVNIALCKYWGKRDARLNLPVTDSLSISMGTLGSRTEIQLQAGAEDHFFLNDEEVAVGSPFGVRVRAFLDLFRAAHVGCELRTWNSIPTAAGLASSASGMAALTLALNQAGAWDLNRRELSILARLGSGSACRSVFNGFVRWQAGQRLDGMDSHAVVLAPAWPELRLGIIRVSDARKPVSSRDGMRRTKETALLYDAWPNRVATDLKELVAAIAAHDFELLGRVAEGNAMSMHATMLDARPPLIYWLPETVNVLLRVAALREQGVRAFATMDAGPNVKIVFLETDTIAVTAAFPGVQVVAPAQTSGDMG